MAEPIATALDPAPTSGPDQSSPRRLHPRTTAGVLLAVAVVVLAWAVVAGPLRHTSSADTTSMTPAMGTATVVRTDVAERQQVAGTLGYAGSLTVVGQQSGTVTAVAAPGRVVGPGGKLAEVDGTAIVMMLGQRPAWRSFAVGMSDGPDVRQLETSLRALGFDPAHAMTIDDHFSFASAAAVRRWQQSLGAPQSGVITLGSVVFLPTPIRVTEDQVLLGALTGPGQPLLAGTTTDHEVSVALDAGRQSLVHVGDQVVVTLPDGTTTTKGGDLCQPSRHRRGVRGRERQHGTHRAGHGRPGGPVRRRPSRSGPGPGGDH